MLLPVAAAKQGEVMEDEEEEPPVMVNDIARAYFEAPVVRAIAIKLLGEDGRGRRSTHVGKPVRDKRCGLKISKKEVRKYTQSHGVS